MGGRWGVRYREALPVVPDRPPRVRVNLHDGGCRWIVGHEVDADEVDRVDGEAVWSRRPAAPRDFAAET